MILKRFYENNNHIFYSKDTDKKDVDDFSTKIEILERISENWNDKLKDEFYSPRVLYKYSIDILKEIEKDFLTENTLKMKNKKPTILISAFPGTGKSYFYKNTKLKVLDSDSSKFDKSKFPRS